jgi:hypothetical protein
MCNEGISKEKTKPNPNLAKSIQIHQNPAKPSLGKSLDFLVRIEPYQRLARTPWAFILLLARSARIASAASKNRAGRGSVPFLHVCIV